MPRRVSRKVLRQLREERLVREAEEQAQQDEKTQQPVEEYPPVEPVRAASHAGIVGQRPTAGQEAQAALRDYKCNQSEKHLPCPQCGTYTQPGTKFCPQCGYNMSQLHEQQAQQQAGEYAPVQFGTTPWAEWSTRTWLNLLPRTRQTIAIAGVCICLAVLLLGAVHIVSSSQGTRIISKVHFTYRETFVSLDAITGMPYIMAKSKYPLSVKACQRAGLIETDEQFERRIQREIDQQMEESKRRIEREMQRYRWW